MAGSLEPLADQLAAVLADPLDDPFTPELVAVPGGGVQAWLTARLARRLGATTPGAVGRHRRQRRVRLPGRPSSAGPWARRPASAAGPPGRSPGPSTTCCRRSAPSWARPPTRCGPGPSPTCSTATRSTAREMVRGWSDGRDVDGTGAPLEAHHRWQPQLWRAVQAHLGGPTDAQLIDELQSRPRGGRRPPTRRRPARAGCRCSVWPRCRRPTSRLIVGPRHPARRPRARPDRVGRPVAAGVADHSPSRCGSRSVAAASDEEPAARWAAGTRWCRAGGGRRARPTSCCSTGALQLAATRSTRRRTGRASDGADRSSPASSTRVRADEPRRPDRQPAGRRPAAALRSRRRPERSAGTGPTAPPARSRSSAMRCCTCSRRPTPTVGPASSRATSPCSAPTWPPSPRWSRPSSPATSTTACPPIPVRVADRTLRQDNPVLDAAASLLDLLDGRFRASSVLAFAARPPVRLRFGLDGRRPRRGSASGSRPPTCGGVSARPITPASASRPISTCTPGRPVSTSCCSARRWPPAGPRLGPGEVAPYATVEGDDVEVAGALAELLDHLERAMTALRAARSGRRLVRRPGRRPQDLCEVPDADAWQWRAVERTIEDLRDRGVGRRRGPHHAGRSRRPGRPCVRSRLSATGGRARFGTGAVTVSSLTAQRGVPHRVVCLLGLDVDAASGGPGRRRISSPPVRASATATHAASSGPSCSTPCSPPVNAC